MMLGRKLYNGDKFIHAFSTKGVRKVFIDRFSVYDSSRPVVIIGKDNFGNKIFEAEWNNTQTQRKSIPKVVADFYIKNYDNIREWSPYYYYRELYSYLNLNAFFNAEDFRIWNNSNLVLEGSFKSFVKLKRLIIEGIRNTNGNSIKLELDFTQRSDWEILWINVNNVHTSTIGSIFDSKNTLKHLRILGTPTNEILGQIDFHLPNIQRFHIQHYPIPNGVLDVDAFGNSLTEMSVLNRNVTNVVWNNQKTNLGYIRFEYFNLQNQFIVNMPNQMPKLDGWQGFIWRFNRGIKPHIVDLHRPLSNMPSSLNTDATFKDDILDLRGDLTDTIKYFQMQMPPHFKIDNDWNINTDFYACNWSLFEDSILDLRPMKNLKRFHGFYFNNSKVQKIYLNNGTNSLQTLYLHAKDNAGDGRKICVIVNDVNNLPSNFYQNGLFNIVDDETQC